MDDESKKSDARLEAERLERLRGRLYAPSADLSHPDRTGLSGEAAERAVEPFPEKPKPPPPPPPPPPAMVARRRKKFRTYLIAGGVIFFALAVILSTALVFFGRSNISGENLVFAVRGPLAVGGGDVLDLSISLANRNAVPIEAAAIIIEYPPGTQSADRAGEELFRERRPIERIGPGETVNLTAHAVVFGEENDEQEVRIAVEYRVAGSNATFSKEAAPFKYRISSAPVSVAVEAVEQAASGTEIEFKVRVASNAAEPISSVVLEARYPFGFDFSRAEPAPASGGRAWVINSLAPGEEREFVIEGLLTGTAGEEKEFAFVTGVASNQDQFAVASVFSERRHTITLDQVAGDVSIRTNGSTGATLSVGAGEELSVELTFTNRLDETLYDLDIRAALSGAAFTSSGVNPQDGSFDGATVRWTSGALSSLREVPRGATRTVRFSLVPDVAAAGNRTPQVALAVKVDGRRVMDDRVARPFTASAAQTVRIESRAELSGSTLYSSGPFANAGPVPPVAGMVTQYTVMLSVENGSNSLADTVVEAALPAGVAWLDLKQSSAGSVSYDAPSRQVRWSLGNLDAGKSESAAFQVSFLPADSHIGTIPALATDVRLRATDRFTGTIIRATAADVRTSAANDPDPDARDGRVRSP